MSSLNWQVESFRFSFIHIESDDKHKDFGWSSITSDRPETVTSKPSLGQSFESGPWLQTVLTVSKQVGRTDVLVSSGDEPSPIQSIGTISTMMDLAKELIPQLVSLRSHRLALGVTLSLPVAKPADGYAYLKKFLPFVSFEDDMSDFFLQINRRKIGVDGVAVNELGKWGCLAFRRLMVGEDGPGQTLEDIHAVRLELDINNPEVTVDIFGDVVVAHLNDFLSRAERISVEGAL